MFHGADQEEHEWELLCFHCFMLSIYTEVEVVFVLVVHSSNKIFYCFLSSIEIY